MPIHIGHHNIDTSIQPTLNRGTVGSTNKLARNCNLYSNPDLSGTVYNYLAKTSFKILENVSENVDKIQVIQTGRVAYVDISNYSDTQPKSYSIMTVTAKSGLRVRSGPSTDSEIITTMGEGERLEVVAELDGWIAVTVDDEDAFISADYAVVEEGLDTAVTMTELLYGDGVSNVRVDLCQYAKEFIGNKYVWGGVSLTNGVDCSGFTMQIYKKYGIKLPHSSVSQSKMGTKVSLSEARAGDLVFYAKGGTVNHVGIYIGNGQIVHASTPASGIKVSTATYRPILSIRRIV